MRGSEGTEGTHTYPLIVTEQAELIASDGQLADALGSAVSLSGDTALLGASSDGVGANVDQGSARVFVRTGLTWTAQATLTANDGAAQDDFADSVSVFGDTAIAGVPKDDGLFADQGSAYVFTRTGTTWSQQAKLGVSDSGFGDQLGNSVSVSGETAIVGAFTKDVGATMNQGAAYVFVRSGNLWSEQAKLTASDGGEYEQFGASVALEGDTAVIGADNATVGANLGQGAAYVFVRSGATWSQQAKLTAGDGAAGDRCGGSVSLSADTAVVGCSRDDAFIGSAYVFSRSGTTWSQQAKLSPSDGAVQDFFGISVSVSGDTTVVGSSQAEVAGQLNQGAAYVFLREGPSWSQRAKLTANDGDVGDFFGWAVSVAGNTTLVGAWGTSVGTEWDQGSAYTFVFDKAALGTPCFSAVECASGFCADGVCCNVACAGGTCAACSITAGAQTDGTCELLTGAVCDDNNACTQNDTCQAGACTSGAIVSDGTPCTGGSCQNGTCEITDAGTTDAATDAGDAAADATAGSGGTAGGAGGSAGGDAGVGGNGGASIGGTGGGNTGGASVGGSSSGGKDGGATKPTDAEDEGGCGCRSAGASRTSHFALLALALAAFSSRRRRNTRPG
jgi:MYXO-CTERM domain-containing protein